MREMASRWRRLVVDATEGSDPARLVVGTGALMVIAQLAFRAWALFPSWFYLDDYSLLLDAKAHHLGLGYLLTPWNSHLMPGGRLLAWLVAQSGSLNWGLAVSLTLALQLLSSVAALWMLTTLFGARWAVLAPLGLYLSTAMTMPALMWWTACLNQLAMQLAFFLAVGAWVRYLRSDRVLWLIVTCGAVAIGLLFDVKPLLIVPVLAFLAVGYFAPGPWLRRPLVLARRHWLAVAVGGPLVLLYLGYYVLHVSQPFAAASPGLLGQLADTMLGTAFASAVAGGPWGWLPLAPPNAVAHPPDWAVHLSWVLVVLVVLYALLRRHATLRAWVLLSGYLGVLLLLLLTSRAPVYGRVIGLEYRYLTDAACAVSLCVGLAFLPLLGAVESSRARTRPLLTLRVPTGATAALVVLVCTLGVGSSVQEVGYWHRDNASDAYMHVLRTDLRDHGAVDLADLPVPDPIYPATFAPDNSVRRLVSLVSDRAAFPDASPRLTVVGADGGLRQAAIKPGVVSKRGPVADCGWPVSSAGRTIPLTGKAFEWVWWLRIGYLANQESPVRVSAGSDEITTTVEPGVNSLYVKLAGTFDSVRIDGLDPGARLCVDTIEVGQPVPGAVLP